MPGTVATNHPLFVPSRNPDGSANGVGDFSPQELRLLSRALSGNVSGPIRVGDLLVTPLGTPGSQVLVAPGWGWVPGTQSAIQGPYLVVLPAQATLDVTPADLTQQRNDIVVLQVLDKDYSGSVYQGQVAYIANATVGAGQPYPTPPANSIVLAQVAVPPGGSTVIAAGNILQVSALAGHAFTDGGPVGVQSNIGPFSQPINLLGRSATPGAPTTGTYPAGSVGMDSNAGLWVSPAGGTPGTWQPSGLIKIGETVLASSAGSIAFSNIPQTFRTLYVTYEGLSSLGSAPNLNMRFNNDASASYHQLMIFIQQTLPSTVQGGTTLSQSSVRVGSVSSGGSPSQSSGWVEIANYTVSRGHALTAQVWDGEFNAQQGMMMWGSYVVAVPITSLMLFPASGVFQATTVVSLYGIP